MAGENGINNTVMSVAWARHTANRYFTSCRYHKVLALFITMLVLKSAWSVMLAGAHLSLLTCCIKADIGPIP